MMQNKTALSDLLILLVTLLAAAGWIFSKEALFGIAPITFLGIRFLLAGVIVGSFQPKQWLQLQWPQIRHAVLIGVLFAVALMLWVTGLFHSDHVGEGAFITSMGVVLVPVVAHFLFGESASNSTWVALPVAIMGLGCLSLNNGFQFEAGQLYFIVAAMLFAIHFNLISYAVAKIPAFVLTAMQLGTVGVVALCVSWVVEPWPPEISLITWWWVLASVVIASAARFLIQTMAQGMASASHAAVILILEPIWTTVAAGFWFGEVMSPLQWLGCSLIFCALLINRWRVVRKLLKDVLA